MPVNLTDTVATDPIRALIYGVTGSAKTTAAAMASLHEELSPIYFFDWDLRIVSIRAAVPERGWPMIKSDPYQDTISPGDAFIRMESMVETINAGEYRTWVIDSMTFMMEGIMARVLALDSKSPHSVPNLKHYMERQSLVKALLGRMRAKPLNLIITCHEDTAKDEVTGKLFKTLDLDPKLQNRVPGYFNELWHTEVAQVVGETSTTNQFKIRTRSNDIYGARTTFKTLSTLEDQNRIWPKIIAESQRFTQKLQQAI